MDDTVEMLDRVLLRRALHERDVKALAILQTRYGPRLKRYIASRINSVTDADDILQDIFAELCQSHSRYNGHRDVEKYLFGMARHLISQYRKSKRNQPQHVEINSIREVAVSYDNQRPRNAVRQISLQQLKRNLEGAMDQLSPKAYEAIKLRFIEGLSPKEAAKKAGCSIDAFYKRLYRATKTLQEIKNERTAVKN